MIVFGLGNPLPQYSNTRHNIGFMVVDRLAEKLKVSFKTTDYYQFVITDISLTLVKPMLYMNNSGFVVSYYLSRNKCSNQFIVIVDDISLPFGRIRIREKGGSGGHNGLASIISALKSENFPRLRIGIGQPPVGVSLTEYVLSEFNSSEKKLLNQILNFACDAILVIKERGIKTAMSIYNSSEPKLTL
ncbi:MAG: aminoacyl-tRNA hydrolase [candidate division WOR-3 bacterium]|nr:aminoacyl-tRNA hydrolase [candidate division WOR-3 bacterium]MCX7757527.1 aminoacyl-tRNA hydrolase [candidate division WOR-3 bacterium]MDW7987184.1 aminoacyl-tRNA hydrolase [candidate division WOR-3 bacterium]